MSYSQKLRDPKWLAVRRRVLARDGHRCTRDANHRMPLEVHHISYASGKEPWQYPLENFITLCRECHLANHRLQFVGPAPRLGRGRFYAWHQISSLVGQTPHGYLTENATAEQIVCGCFRLDLNPDAPDIVLPGTRGDWLRKARLLQKQNTPIPIFISAEGLPWEYVGRFTLEAMTQSAAEIAIHRERTHRTDIGLVMFLQPA